MYNKKEKNLDDNLGIFTRVSKIFYSPDEVFKEILNKPSLFKGILTLMIIFTGIYFSQITLLREFVIEKFKENPKKYAEITKDMVNKEVYSNIIIGVFTAFINPIFKGLFVYGLSLLYNKKAKLKSTIGIFIYSYFIIAFGQIFSSIVRNYSDNIYANFSPAVFLTSLNPQSYIYIFASYFDIFTIIYLYITIKGVKLINDISYQKASFIVLVPTAMYLFTTLISTFQ